MANLDIIIRAVDEASGTIDGIGGKLGSLAGTATKLVAGAGVAAFGALTAAIGVSVNKAADMEQRVADLASVMGLAKGETQPLSDLIMNLGLDPKLKVSATEASDAIMALATNGLSMTDIMDGAARSSVLLANSTGADFGQAATIATDVMSLFNISAADMTRAVDGITGVTVASKFGINDYALALAQGGGVASAVGVSFEDFNTSIAATSSFFSSGADAGTSYKTFLQRLVPTTDSARGAMSELGLITADGSNAFFDASGNMKSMQEITGILQAAIGGLSDEQKNQYTSTIFGTDAMRTAIGLAETGSERFNELAGQIGATSAEMSAATRMDTFSGAMEVLWGIVETLSINIGQAFLPGARAIVEWATEMAQTHGPALVAWFGRLADFVAAAIPQITAFALVIFDAAGEIIDWVTGTDSEFTTLNSIYDNMVAFVTNAYTGLVDYIRSNLGAWSSAIGEWASAAWRWLVDTAIPTALAKLGQWSSALIGYIADKSPAWIEALGAWASAAWRWISDVAIPLALSKLAEWGRMLLSWLGDNLPSLIHTLAGWAAAAAAWILNAAAELVRNAATVLTHLTGWIESAGEGNLIASLQTWVSAMWRWVKDTLWPLLEPALRNLGSALLELLVAIGGLLWAEMKSIGSLLWEGFKAGVNAMWGGIVSWWNGLWDSLVGRVRDTFDLGSPSRLFAQYGGWVMEGFTQGIDAKGAESVQALDRWMSTLTTNASTGAASIAAVLAGTTGASSAGLGTPTVNTSSESAIQDSLGNWKATLASLGRQFVTNTQSTIAGAIDDNPQYSGYLQSVSGALASMGNTFANLNAYSPLDALRAAFTQLSDLRNEINLNVHGLLNRQQLGANYTINVTGSGEVGQDVINAVQYLQGLTV